MCLSTQHYLSRLLFLLLLLACIPARAQDDPLFKKLSARESGVDFKNQLKEDREHNILTYEYFYNGGGVAVGDINNDGLDDIFFTANMDDNRLYLNEGNMQFKDITDQAGVAGRPGAWSTGVNMVDINRDGLLDIYVCYSGWQAEDMRRNELYINRGNLKFEEQAADYGLDDPSNSTHAAFADFDKDGDLDMYLLNHNTAVIYEVEYNDVRHTRHPQAGDKFYENQNGKFVDISEQAGIKGSPLGFGLGIAIADVNGDGWQDIYVSNDYIEPDYLYINQQDGTFSDQMTDYFQHISYFSMGSDIADINNDAQPDIFTLDMLPEDNERQKLLYGPDNYEQYALMVMNGFYHQNMRNMLHVNNGNGRDGHPTFSEVGQLSGISNTDWSWSSLFADFDNDGRKDLFITNGYYRDYTNRDFLKYKGDYFFQKAINQEKADTFQLVLSMTSTPVRNYMYHNQGDLNFADKSEAWGFGDKTFSNGAAYSDLDNDGDLDLVISNLNERSFVYQNLSQEQGKAGHYLDVALKAKKLSALGAKVRVYAQGDVQFFEYMPTRGFQSSVSHRIHVGLGDSKKVDSVVVDWPSGTRQVARKVKADRLLVIEEKGEDAPLPDATMAAGCHFSPVPGLVSYQHQEYAYNDFKRQPLLMNMLTTCGPVMEQGDINQDGRADIFLGGAKGGLGKIYVQTENGQYEEKPQTFADNDLLTTDADATFFDADGDGDQDLYIASGGYQDFNPHDLLLQDRLYLNDGEGNFTFAQGALPQMFVSKSSVAPADFDGDGDMDLFVGGRVIPGQYPLAPQSYLLENDGSGTFTNVISDKLAHLQAAGMITDALWTDLNGDGFPDLITAGEYMPIQVALNQGGERFTDATDQYFERPLSGLWNKLLLADFDNDGDQDIVAANFGENSQLKVSPEEPLTLVYKDFDENGSVDPIVTHYIQGESYPFPSRGELLNQIISMRQKFTTYADYADARLEDIFTKDQLRDAAELRAETLETVYLENQGGKFVPKKLPIEAQFAPVFAMTTLDYNQDGNLDLLLAGNQSAIRIRMGVIDANYGQLLQGDGQGNFTYVPQPQSGLMLKGDVKSMQRVEVGEDTYLLVGVNNAGVESYKLTKP
jgi:hypothetical protein